MRIFGYIEGDDHEIVSLAEITLQAEPMTLRAIAGFLHKCASEIESNQTWEHAHFSDSEFSSGSSSPDLIVYHRS